MATATLIDQLSELAADVLKDARSDAKPILKEGKRIARDRGKALAKQAKKAKEAAKAEAEAIKAAAHPAKPLKKKRRGRKLLLLALVVGAVALAAKKLLGDRKAASLSSGWVEAPTTAGKHASAPASETPAADDAAGATPDEALADATEEPHPVTTPDAPAEVVELAEPEEAEEAEEADQASRGTAAP